MFKLNKFHHRHLIVIVVTNSVGNQYLGLANAVAERLVGHLLDGISC
jgi:hypothetical protein